MQITFEALIVSHPLQSVSDIRKEVVRVARTWIGTKYVSNAMVKGSGTDCAMLLLAVYQEVGLVPESFVAERYSPQWHLHRGEEKYMQVVLAFAHEVIGPPLRAPLPGDVVMFKVARAYAHAAIITNWPRLIHARGDTQAVVEEDISQNAFGKHALWRQERKFFSGWTD